MVKVGDKMLAFSAVYAAMTAYTDATNDDVPNLSPSNHLLKATATVLKGRNGGVSGSDAGERFKRSGHRDSAL